MKHSIKLALLTTIIGLSFGALVAEAALLANLTWSKIPTGIRVSIDSISGVPIQPGMTVSLYALYGESNSNLNKKTTSAVVNTIPKTVDINVPHDVTKNYYFRLYFKPNNCPTPSVCTNPNTSDGYFPYLASGSEPYTFMIPGVNPSNQIGSSSNIGIGSSSNQAPESSTALLKDPLNGKFPNIASFLKALFDVIIVIAIPIVAIMIIWSGFLIVSARGNEEKLTKGKKAFVAAVIGGVLVLGAYVIAQAIETTVKQITE